MLHIGKTTKQSPKEIIAEAETFFGPGGVGLDVEAREPNRVSFTGGGGYIVLQVEPADDGSESEVDIESREWDYDVRRFLRQL